MKWNKGEQQRPFHKSGSTEDAEALTMRHSSSTKLPLQAFQVSTRRRRRRGGWRTLFRRIVFGFKYSLPLWDPFRNLHQPPVVSNCVVVAANFFDCVTPRRLGHHHQLRIIVIIIAILRMGQIFIIVHGRSSSSSSSSLSSLVVSFTQKILLGVLS